MKGRILYHMNNVGITLEELGNIPLVIIAAGGTSKGAAILAMASAGVRGTLITDEGAAKEIIRLAGSS
jgi:central glycolytic genes regulator